MTASILLSASCGLLHSYAFHNATCNWINYVKAQRNCVLSLPYVHYRQQRRGAQLYMTLEYYFYLFCIGLVIAFVVMYIKHSINYFLRIHSKYITQKEDIMSTYACIFLL